MLLCFDLLTETLLHGVCNWSFYHAFTTNHLPKVPCLVVWSWFIQVCLWSIVGDAFHWSFLATLIHDPLVQSHSFKFIPFIIMSFIQGVQKIKFDQRLTLVNRWLLGQLWPKSTHPFKDPFSSNLHTYIYFNIIPCISISFIEENKKINLDQRLTLANCWLFGQLLTFWPTLTKVNILFSKA